MQKNINYVDDGKSMLNMMYAHYVVRPWGLTESFGYLLKHLNIQNKANLLYFFLKNNYNNKVDNMVHKIMEVHQSNELGQKKKMINSRRPWLTMAQH